MCVHICRNTHRGTETTYLNKRHIEFLHTDTQTPASTPPTTATITAPTGPLKHNPRGDILTHEQCQSWNYVQEERGGRSHIWCKEKGMQHFFFFKLIWTCKESNHRSSVRLIVFIFHAETKQSQELIRLYKRRSLQTRGEWLRVWFPLNPHAADLVVSGVRRGWGNGMRRK